MTTLGKAVTERPALRKIAIPAYRAYARAMVFNRGPRVLAVSMPKAGTHLLAALLSNLPQMMFSGRHHVLRDFELPDARPPGERQGLNESELDWQRFERALAAVRKGQYLTAHFAALPKLVSLLAELEYRTIVMMRDPRDVAVSSVFYITRLERHPLHERFTTELKDFNERLMASIVGLPATRDRRGLASIGRRIGRYQRWQEVPNVLVCRFEDLVGPSGGGSAEAQRGAIAAISEHVQRHLSPARIDAVAAKTWSQKSSTFRKGAIGDWTNHFSEEHRRAFKEIAGAQLVELGYERSLDW
jgi:hypothetical protein